jgi:hypothetical protein
VQNTRPLFHSTQLTLSVSEAKKTAPLPTPSVPFFFFPFLSSSEMLQVSTSSLTSPGAA